MFMLMNNSSFRNWTTTQTHINRHTNWQQHAIVESTRVVKVLDESYGSMDSWGQLCDGVILMRCIFLVDRSKQHTATITRNTRMETGRKRDSRIVRIVRFVKTAVRRFPLMRCIFRVDRSCIRVISLSEYWTCMGGTVAPVSISTTSAMTDAVTCQMPSWTFKSHYLT